MWPRSRRRWSRVAQPRGLPGAARWPNRVGVPRRIESFSNETVKRLRALHDKRSRRDAGLFLAEGLRVCTEAADAGRLPAVLLVAEDAADHPLTARLVADVDREGGDAAITTRAILAKVSGKDNAAGVVGAYAIPPTPLSGIDRAAAPMWVVCEGLKDSGNLGTILRTCDATGAGGVILLDQSCDPFSVEAVRASMGAIFTRAVAQASGAEFFGWLRAAPGMLVGTFLGPGTVDYQAVAYGEPTFLFMGNEQSGLPTDYAARCNVLVRMPMAGTADSLNVAVACGVMLYEMVNQRRAKVTVS